MRAMVKFLVVVLSSAATLIVMGWLGFPASSDDLTRYLALCALYQTFVLESR